MQRNSVIALMTGAIFLAGCGGAGSFAPHPSKQNAPSSIGRQYRSVAEGVAAGIIKPVCGPVGPGRARCTSYIVVQSDASRAAQSGARSTSSAAPLPDGYGPGDLQSAYRLTAAARTRGDGVTVAIVDAYDTPQAEQDLAVYRARYGLPPCTSANRCFRKVNQRGRSAPLPPVAPPDFAGWQVETMLDLDMVSANCPKCKIVLVETDDDFMNNLGAGANAAAEFEPAAISNSYVGQESPTDPGPANKDGLLPYYVHPNIAVVAGTGDFGYMTNVNAFDGTQYIAFGAAIPAAFPSVVAVGGTELVRDPSVARGWTETVWGSTGSGCSAYEAAAPWQQTVPGCVATFTAANGHTRSVPSRVYGDIAYAADNVAMYDSVPAPSASWYGGWGVTAGTSIAAPSIAAIYALAGYGPNGDRNSDDGDFPARKLYASRRSLFDVAAGSNLDGTGPNCSMALLCNAGAGYDGPSGNGSPNGLGAF